MTATVDASVRRYRAEISDKELDELRGRIAARRWPDRETVALFSAELRAAFRTLRSR